MIVELSIPMAPMPKQRPRFGQGRAYNSAEYTQWKRDFGVHCWGKQPLGKGPFGISARFVTNSGKMRPDLDNALGAVLDALQEAGIITNDRHAVHLEADIKQGAGPRIEIALWAE